MTDRELEKLKYPIGIMLKEKADFTAGETERNIKTIEELPSKLRKAIDGLNDEQMDTPYRPGGWTSRILVHHLGDSHMHGYIRMKLALTEDTPTIKPYFEDRWAKLADYKETPVAVSLALVENLHLRWVIFLRSLKNSDLKRAYYHPEHNMKFTIEQAVYQYSWHSEHHLAHITELRKRTGW